VGRAPDGATAATGRDEAVPENADRAVPENEDRAVPENDEWSQRDGPIGPRRMGRSTRDPRALGDDHAAALVKTIGAVAQ
jgi:hypothetical protein